MVASIGSALPPAIGLLAERIGLLGSFWILVVFIGAAIAAAGSLIEPRERSGVLD